MLTMYKYACPDCGAVWSEVSDWSEAQVCPKCDREDVAPGVSHQVPPDVAREYLGRALASCRVMLDAWGTKSLTDLERAAQSCAESVTEFEVAVQTATLDGPVVDEPTAAAALDMFLARWGPVFENEQADVNGGDLVEWVGEWLPSVFAAVGGKAVQRG